MLYYNQHNKNGHLVHSGTPARCFQIFKGVIMNNRKSNPSLDDQKKIRLEQKALKRDALGVIKRLELLEQQQQQLELQERMDQLNLLGKEVRDLRERLNRLEQMEQKLLKKQPSK